MSGVNWLEVVVGFALGLAPLAARQIYTLIRYSRLPGRRKYLGKWWVYHKSTTGSGQVYERTITIRYSFVFDRLSVRAQDSRLAYSGYISRRQGMVRYFSLADDASHERLTWYIFDPFQEPIEQTAGLYLALDLRGLPVAGPILMSRQQLQIPMAASRLVGDVLKTEATDGRA